MSIPSPKTAIITGLNGQLGQYMAQYLFDNHPDIRVIGTIRHKSYDNQGLLFDRSRVTVELMDLCDPHSIETLILKWKPDYFINTAANAFVGESWQVPAQHFELNALAVLHQLEAIRKHSPQTRYFNMGTSEEFGATEKSFLDESSPLAPRSPYGASKCAARFIVKVWRESYGLYAIQGWTFNFESPIRGEKYLTRKVTKGVARIARAIADGKPFEPIELGNLDSHRSWQFAGDVADGIWRMLNQENYSEAVSQGEDPKEYILSAPDVHTVRDFVEKAFAAAGITGGFWDREEPIVERGHLETFDWVNVAASTGHTLVRINPAFLRPADVTYLHGNAEAIRHDLGWSPKVSFDQLVERMVRADLAAVGL